MNLHFWYIQLSSQTCLFVNLTYQSTLSPELDITTFFPAFCIVSLEAQVGQKFANIIRNPSLLIVVDEEKKFSFWFTWISSWVTPVIYLIYISALDISDNQLFFFGHKNWTWFFLFSCLNNTIKTLANDVKIFYHWK